MAVDPGDHRLRVPDDAGQHVAHPGTAIVLSDPPFGPLHAAQVGAGAERPVAGPRHDRHVGLVVGVELAPCVDQSVVRRHVSLYRRADGLPFTDALALEREVADEWAASRNP